jgi:hypothetical protein
LLAICGNWTDNDPTCNLSGNILSIYEKTDELGSSCQSLSEKSEGIPLFHTEYREGTQGILYRRSPLDKTSVIPDFRIIQMSVSITGYHVILSDGAHPLP